VSGLSGSTGWSPAHISRGARGDRARRRGYDTVGSVTAVPTSPYRTYRQPESFWMLNLVAAVLAATAVLTFDTGVRFLCAVMVVTALWGAWWIRLTATPSGLTVVFIRSRHIPWSDVRRLSLDARRWRWTGCVLTVITSEGESVRIWAVSARPGGSEKFCKESLRLLQAARQQHRSR
jgi:hypothetical protein